MKTNVIVAVLSVLFSIVVGITLSSRQHAPHHRPVSLHLTAFAQSPEMSLSVQSQPKPDMYGETHLSISETSETLPLTETVCLPLTSSPELTALQQSTGKNFALIGGGYQVRQKVVEHICTPLALTAKPSANDQRALTLLPATVPAPNVVAASEHGTQVETQNPHSTRAASVQSVQLAWWMGDVVKPSSDAPSNSSSAAVSHIQHTQPLTQQQQAVSSLATQSLSLTSQSLSREDTWQQPLHTSASTRTTQAESLPFSAATQVSASAVPASTTPVLFHHAQHHQQRLPEYPVPLNVNGAWMIETLQHPAGKTSTEAQDTLTASTPTTMLAVRVYSKQFPKPDAQVVRIHYTVPEQAIVRLQVLDVAGKEVTKLVELMHGAGEYEAEWHGKRADGSPAESGLYHYRLTMLYANKRINTQMGSLAFVR